LSKGHILTVFGAKPAIVHRTKLQSPRRGYPRTGPPRRETRSAKFTLHLYPPRAAPALRIALHALEQAHIRLRVRYPRTGSQILRICFWRGAEPPQSPVSGAAGNAPNHQISRKSALRATHASPSALSAASVSGLSYRFSSRAWRSTRR
jgi:hypothetical protein